MRSARGGRSAGRGWRWWTLRVMLPPCLCLLFLLQPAFYFGIYPVFNQAKAEGAKAGSLRSWDDRMRALDARRGNWGAATESVDAGGGGGEQEREEEAEGGPDFHNFVAPSVAVGWPPMNELSRQMLQFNKKGSWVNADSPVSASSLGSDVIPIVLYVHNRPSYLRVVLDALSKVHGIEETLLIVSHDGYYTEVAEIVRNVTFTRVKQVFAPYSPHNFVDSFPNISPGDCPERPAPGEVQAGCAGDADQYGNYRAPRIVSLKHHWFWLMTHVWEEMEGLRGFAGHVMFMEEDHVLAPNAYRTLQVLARVQRSRCPHCVAINLGMPLHDGGDPAGEYFVADWMANMGYAFNRSTWEHIKESARTFCTYSDYNWDETLKWAVMAYWAPTRLGLHAAGPPIMHMGKCGLHGQTEGSAGCSEIDDQAAAFLEMERDRTVPDESWRIEEVPQDLNRMGFSGWGGWGDRRDHKLCMFFAGLSEGLEAARRHS